MLLGRIAHMVCIVEPDRIEVSRNGIALNGRVGSLILTVGKVVSRSRALLRLLLVVPFRQFLYGMYMLLMVCTRVVHSKGPDNI